MAEQYDVSRTPVREALRHLAATGIVEFRPRHGVCVMLHEMVWLGARNQILIESIARMRSRSMLYTRLEYMVQNTTAMLSYAEHESVVQAIIGQKPELAYQAMRGAVKSHLYNGKIDSPLLLGVSLNEAGPANAVADHVIAA